MNNVIWKPLNGWENTHVISSEGIIKKLPYIDTLGRYWGERTIKPFKSRSGYLVAYLDYHGKTERTSVHRLVARTFIPNPLNLPQVNHKDEDKTNNNVSNLEWCDQSYNQKYGTARARAIQTCNTKGYRNAEKPVIQMTLDGVVIAEYESQAEAARHGFRKSEIHRCCHGFRKSHGGYRWEYK